MRPRVLIAVTVYNGRSFVPRALQSLVRLDRDVADIDVLVLDDHSPEPGWSDELGKLCASLGFLHYRTPRNLGIPRNVNLGLLGAVEGGYDHVIISNSDVVYSRQAVSQLVRAAESDPKISSVTSWSTNVSVYSLPNSDPDAYLADQERADWVGEVLGAQFGHRVLDIPTGVGFVMLVPTRVIADVGLMDPVFGRGYCEETDWSLRCLAAGYRLTLGMGAFVYHKGGGSNVEAGLVSKGQTTVPKNERIIDMRYPQFREQVGAFLASGNLERSLAEARQALVSGAAAALGYSVTVGWLPQTIDSTRPHVHITPDPASRCAVATFSGFALQLEIGAPTAAADLVRALGVPPSELNLLDGGPVAAAFADAFGATTVVHRRQPYPSRI
jgi:GT2 family glycosyltransferase